jgi:hypothetical protein
MVRARVLVHDGLVWGKFFRVMVEVSPQETHLFGPYGYGSIGSFKGPKIELTVTEIRRKGLIAALRARAGRP